MRCKAGLFSRLVEFSPTSIAGLTAWLDASDAATLFDEDVGGSATGADGEVGRLEDKTGNGRHFVQATSAHRPIRKVSQQNGRDIVRFDGVNDRLVMSGEFSDLASSTASTVFLVAKAATVGTDSETETSNAAILSESSQAHGFGMLRSNDTAAAFGFGVSPFAMTTVSLSYVPGNWKVFSTLHDGVDLAFRINGGSAATGTLATRAFMGGSVQLGSNYNASQCLDGDIGEVIVYNIGLSPTERQAVESYLMTKWGIA
jgi:hypothetical protein